MIKVFAATHEKAKRKADERGMTLQGYIRYLVNKDNRKYKPKR